jgi:hypothetical protein
MCIGKARPPGLARRRRTQLRSAMLGIHGDFHAQTQIDGYGSFPDHDDSLLLANDSKATMRAPCSGRYATIMILGS